MKKRKRIYYTPEQKSLIWGRDKQGVSLHHITRMFESYHSHSSVMPTIYQAGDIAPQKEKDIQAP